MLTANPSLRLRSTRLFLTKNTSIFVRMGEWYGRVTRSKELGRSQEGSKKGHRVEFFRGNLGNNQVSVIRKYSLPKWVMAEWADDAPVRAIKPRH